MDRSRDEPPSSSPANRDARSANLKLVTTDDLTAAEQDPCIQRAADGLHRYAEDLELYNVLAESGFQGPKYNLFAEQLAAYGLAVTRAWFHTGKLFAECKRRGYSIGYKPTDISDEDIESLTDDTVTRALRKFHKDALCGRKWDPTRGASLKTYFITGCVYEFLNPYRSWKRSQKNLEKTVLVEPGDTDLLDQASWDDIEEHVIGQASTKDLLRQLRPHEKIIIVFRSCGYSWPEIAEVLGEPNPRAVAQQLQRLRKRLHNGGWAS